MSNGCFLVPLPAVGGENKNETNVVVSICPFVSLLSPVAVLDSRFLRQVSLSSFQRRGWVGGGRGVLSLALPPL